MLRRAANIQAGDDANDLHGCLQFPTDEGEVTPGRDGGAVNNLSIEQSARASAGELAGR